MRNILSQLYPAIVVLSVLAILAAHKAHAGHVRQLELGPDRPGVVNLAFGRTTAISFSVRPEKVVPGSPQAIEVNFLGKDITIRPLTSKPGNLLVYTKSSRYVILLQLGNDSQYDDVVKVAPSFSKTPLRLLEDTYRIVNFDIISGSKLGTGKPQQIPVMLSSSEKSIEGTDLKEALDPYKPLTCSSCVVHRETDAIKISCVKSIQEIHCHCPKGELLLKKVPS
jgi:hypothetical protein